MVQPLMLLTFIICCIYLILIDSWFTIWWSSVRLGAAATAFIHKLQKGIPPWVPLKGHEKKTYKQLQQEAVESKRRDLAVLEANDGVWPGVRIPSHALFLWASGSELTTILEEDDHMPNKYIPKDVRYVYAAGILPFLSLLHLIDRNLLVCIGAKRKQLLEVICQGSHSFLEKDSIIFC